MEKTYKNCQSCGMPMKRDVKGGGSNADGTTNPKFCSYCYENGQFKTPDMTLPEMQTLVKEKLKEFGFPGFVAGMFTWNIPKLERWRKEKEKENRGLRMD